MAGMGLTPPMLAGAAKIATPKTPDLTRLLPVLPRLTGIEDDNGSLPSAEFDKILASNIPQVHTYPGWMGLASIGEGINRGLTIAELRRNYQQRENAASSAINQFIGGMAGAPPGAGRPSPGIGAAPPTSGAPAPSGMGTAAPASASPGIGATTPDRVAQTTPQPQPAPAQPTQPDFTAMRNQEMARLQQEMRALAPLLQNPQTRGAAMQQFMALRSQMDPVAMEKRLTELHLLRNPPPKITTVPEGAGVLVTDRYGNARMLPGTGHSKAPPGYQWSSDNASLKRVPGGPADEKFQTGAAADYRSGSSVLASLDALKKAATELRNSEGLPNLLGNSAYQMLPDVKGSTRDARAQFETLRAKVITNALQAMRDASKTGGAVGALSNQEAEWLGNSIAPLEKAQTYEQMAKALEDIIAYADASKGRIYDAYKNTYRGESVQPLPGMPGMLSPEKRSAVIDRLQKADPATREQMLKELQQRGIDPSQLGGR